MSEWNPVHRSEQVLNPYASPTTDTRFTAEASSSQEAIRKAHIKHEASIKSIGTLYLIGAIFLVIVGIAVLTIGVSSAIGGRPEGELGLISGVVGGLIYLSLGIFQGMTAFGLRSLKSWARIAAIIFSVIGLIGFPIGTLVSAYFLYLLLSQKGQYIFTDEYRAIVDATPHIKYKTSIVVWIFLFLLLALLAVAILAAIFNR